MRHAHVQPRGSAAQSPRHRVSRQRVLIALAIIFLLAPAVAWLARPASVLDLSVGNRLARSGLAASWAQGDVIVLLRHAERCDRTKRTCLGPSNGITLHGSAVATQLASAFVAMGLANTDVIANNTVRAEQTARLVFNQQAMTQQWLYTCSGDVLGMALAQKNAHRNLALVTQGACLDRLEAQLGIGNGPDTPYASQLFIVAGSDGKPRILGLMRAKNWPMLVTAAHG